MLGEVVGVAGFFPGEVGGVMLTQEWLPVDGSQELDCEATEACTMGELAVLPRFVGAFVVEMTVKIDFHGVFH